MNTIEKIKELKSAKGARNYGHHVPYNLTGDAILELAERLDKLEASREAMAALIRYKHDPSLPPITPMPRHAAAESPPEPFTIAGPGRYRTANNGVVDLRSIWDGNPFWPWTDGTGVAATNSFWNEYGRPFSGNQIKSAIIAGPLPDKPAVKTQEMTGLTGFITLTPDGRAYSGLAIDLASASVPEAHIVIDLSEVPARAIVQPTPEPAQETRKVSISFFPNGTAVGHAHGKTTAKMVDGETILPVAIVEREIAFTHGEGIEAGQ